MFPFDGFRAFNIVVAIGRALGFLCLLRRMLVFGVADCQPMRTQRGRIIGELPPFTSGFTQLSIERLDRVSGVEHLSCRRRELQNRYEPFPNFLPNLD